MPYYRNLNEEDKILEKENPYSCLYWCIQYVIQGPKISARLLHDYNQLQSIRNLILFILGPNIGCTITKGVFGNHIPGDFCPKIPRDITFCCLVLQIPNDMLGPKSTKLSIFRSDPPPSDLKIQGGVYKLKSTVKSNPPTPKQKKSNETLANRSSSFLRIFQTSGSISLEHLSLSLSIYIHIALLRRLLSLDRLCCDCIFSLLSLLRLRVSKPLSLSLSTNRRLFYSNWSICAVRIFFFHWSLGFSIEV